MPEMDLGDIGSIDFMVPLPDPLPPEVMEAGLRLLSYAAWPTNKVRRDQYMAKLGVSGQAYTALALQPDDVFPGGTSPELKADTRRRATDWIQTTHIAPFGGYDTSLNSPSSDALFKEHAAAIPKLLAVGRLLLLVRTIESHHKSGSINKAYKLIEHDTPKVREATARKYWRGYKSVATLGAAALDGPPDPDGLNFAWRDLGNTLAIARDYEQFAFSHYSQGQEGPLLDPKKSWTVPQGLRLPAAVTQLPPLSAVLSVALGNYRAPVPGS